MSGWACDASASSTMPPNAIRAARRLPGTSRSPTTPARYSGIHAYGAVMLIHTAYWNAFALNAVSAVVRNPPVRCAGADSLDAAAIARTAEHDVLVHEISCNDVHATGDELAQARMNAERVHEHEQATEVEAVGDREHHHEPREL